MSATICGPSGNGRHTATYAYAAKARDVTGWMLRHPASLDPDEQQS